LQPSGKLIPSREIIVNAALTRNNAGRNEKPCCNVSIRTRLSQSNLCRSDDSGILVAKVAYEQFVCASTSGLRLTARNSERCLIMASRSPVAALGAGPRGLFVAEVE
jgi:hypothetical protein